MKWRELVAVLVIAAGGTLWLLVPDQQSDGSLRDDSAIARWRVKPGTALAAWVLVDNAGPRTITLTGARVVNELPAGTEVLAARARIGKVLTIDDVYPGPPGPFLRLEGFEIPPNRGATIGFGLRLPASGTVALEDVRVTYRENGETHELRAGHTARLCVAVSRRACSA
ncbi:MAG: hypothetical protein ACJ762_15960 [Solirubrobacteraceae bacterium]